MTTTEIKKVIEETIKGQGNQVDLGGKLADILLELSGANPLEVKNVPSGFQSKTKAQVAETLGITEEQVDALYNGEYLYIKRKAVAILSRIGILLDSVNFGVLYGGQEISTDGLWGNTLFFSCDQDGYNLNVGEL